MMFSLSQRAMRARRFAMLLREFKPQFVCLILLVFLAPPLHGREAWNAPKEASQRQNPLSASKDAIARGKRLYADRCVDCHGRKGRGDGPGAADLDVRPIDFSQARVREQSDGALFWKISEGRKPMPAYGRKLSEEERWSLVVYLRSLSGR